ncbi:hypothetical protein ASPBRDRAFT_398512 [Aspergillus brasiliensis CBS 101740]|uniref:Uncharacterized protein n=1 Tax=Aspergillus brasiliensis (strain CBS 101740 / IMI 381727 / IBT 21946) TaxID=767769 RepID=A0A1L9UWX0_ASPBC|nr:hypothetical protein ASPBRDRAFT_398512 [Aspergillus brasiliensis CBS 101740]
MGPAAGCSLIDQLLVSDPIGMPHPLNGRKSMMLNSRQKFLSLFLPPSPRLRRPVFYSFALLPSLILTVLTLLQY